MSADEPLLTNGRTEDDCPPSYGAVNGPVEELRSRRLLRPSPIWILALSAIAAISTSGVVAPRIEIYTRTICQVYGVDATADECLSDRAVQAAVAQLIAVFSTTSGLLTTLTTAWWGSLSDGYGRMWVLGFNVAGLIVSDLSFLTVATFWDRLPGTYWWYVVGPAVEGLVGGMSVASVMMHAYISDCSDPATRSRAFSQLMGLLFFGMSVGPLVSGFIMRVTSRLFPVFYVTTSIDILVALFVWLIIPESLSSATMLERRAAQTVTYPSDEAGRGVLGRLKSLGSSFDVVSPLSVLLPARMETPGKGQVLDWNLTTLGAAYGFGTLVMASAYQQLQYASLTFGWTSETINYWMGGINISKAVYLTLIFPGIVQLLSNFYAPTQPETPAEDAESNPLLLPSGELEEPSIAISPTPKKLLRAAPLDLILARAALVSDMIFYALTPTAATGALFAAYGMCISLGASFGPVMQSLALDLYARRGGADTGRLLGALTVVSALSSHIVGPTLFGVTYMKTVATTPGAIYGLCCASLFASTAARRTMSTSRPASRDVSRLRNDEPSRSRSRPGSRPRGSRHTTTASIPLLPQGPEDLMVPGGEIGEETAELLHEFVHPHHDTEETLVGEEGPIGGAAEGVDPEEDNLKVDPLWRKKLPWWKRPSPWWFLGYVPFSAIAMTITAAAKIELFTYLACEVHKPVVNPDTDVLSFLKSGNTSMTFDHPSQKVCHADPVVSAAVAELNIILTSVMGILSCMTTAWWGSLSDRFGRTTVLSCAVVGILLTDVSIMLVYYFYERLPGGYMFLIVGPILEGLLGGLTSMSGNIHAYMSDCTSPANRAKIFSRYLGLLFTGMAIGPTLGGLVIRFSGSFISVFYIATGLHLFFALLIWFVIPESLSPQEMKAAQIRQEVEDEEYRAAHRHGGTLVLLKKMFAFLTPLLLFVPIALNEGGTPSKANRRDWSLCLVVAAYGFTVSLMGAYVYVMQYIQTFFEWNTEQVGYWFSTVGVTRALFLTLVLPVIIRRAKPAPPVQLPTSPAEPLDSSDATTSTDASPRAPSPAPQGSTPNHHHSSAFDLRLARISLLVDAAAYLLFTIAPTGMMFAAASCLGSLGMGFGPAIQSVALTLYSRRGGKDTGKLFGALSVVQALSAQIFGPFIYGVTYAKTVATFPKAVFFVGAGAVITSCILLAFVRLPKDAPPPLDMDVEEQLQSPAAPTHPDREETLVDPAQPLIVIDDGEDMAGKIVKP
ncbi:major facilitator superfamily domain-containing protein [Trametes meyenii]|nr:major facilitator superfamily domain-containing protein [Trametes meyenii]